MTRWWLALALVAGCKQAASPPKPAPKVPAMSASEVQRSKDACATYVERVCACAETVPAVAEQCKLSHALPDAIRLSLEIAASPDSKPADVRGAQSSVRKTVKECIEQTAKLPTLGCPAR